MNIGKLQLKDKIWLKDYIEKGMKNLGAGTIGAIINWSILYLITQHFGLWYIYSEVIATGFAWFFNYNFNIFLKVIHIESNKQILPIQETNKSEKSNEPFN